MSWIALLIQGIQALGQSNNKIETVAQAGTIPSLIPLDVLHARAGSRLKPSNLGISLHTHHSWWQVPLTKVAGSCQSPFSEVTLACVS